jgi:hypothetical protein
MAFYGGGTGGDGVWIGFMSTMVTAHDMPGSGSRCAWDRVAWVANWAIPDARVEVTALSTDHIWQIRSIVS